MATAPISHLRKYYKLSKYDINRTDINSREDKYQDAILKRLENESKKNSKKSRKNQKISGSN